jgi:hypothetical protein
MHTSKTGYRAQRIAKAIKAAIVIDRQLQSPLENTHMHRGVGVFALACLIAASSITSLGDDSPTIPVAGFIGCRDWEVLQKILEYDRSGDKVAAGKLISTTFDTGECIRFRAGQQVYPTEWGAWTGSVRLRPAGETVEYWTTYPNKWTPDFITGKLSRIGPVR